MAICSKALKRAGLNELSEEMTNKVMNAKSYDEALAIMCKYIEPVDVNYEDFDLDDYEI